MEIGTGSHGKDFMSWKVSIKSIIAQIIMIDVHKYGVKCWASLRFWENNGSINPIKPYGWFQ